MTVAGFGVVWIVAVALLALALWIAIRWVNHKFSKRRAWSMINAEREDNKNRFRRIADSFGSIAQQIQTNGAVIEPLRTRSDIQPESLVGRVVWNYDFPEFNDSAWQTIRKAGLNRLFRPDESREVEELYTDFGILQASMAKVRQELDAGNGAAALERLQAVRAAHDQLGADMRHFTRMHTDFVPSV